MKNFTASNLRGTCTIDPDFEPYLESMNQVAVSHNIIVHVTSSYRPDANVKGAIVTPATHSNHMVGHAIDCNLEKDGVLYNSKTMGTLTDFIADVKSHGLRWGGDFGTPDTVHFDDGLNVRDMESWEEKWRKLHS